MKVSGHLSGGAGIVRRYIIAADFSYPGIPAKGTGASHTGIIPTSTTDCTSAIGLALDTGLSDEGYTGTYSATPSAGALGAVAVSVRPDAIIQALMCGGATEGTSLTVVTEQSGDTSTPDTITSTDVTTADVIGGTVWRRQPVGCQASWHDIRPLNAWTTGTSVATAIDFEYAINIGDEFLICPWTMLPGDGTDTSDGNGNLQTTAAFYQANAEIDSGTGITCAIFNLILRSETDSMVEFINMSHTFGQSVT